MKYILISFLILGDIISLSTALVFKTTVKIGKNGCNFKNQDFEVYDAVQDPETCGIYVCQSTEGDALIYYCQYPLPYANCKGDGVSTVTDFPQCCWMCVRYIKCG